MEVAQYWEGLGEQRPEESQCALGWGWGLGMELRVLSPWCSHALTGPPCAGPLGAFRPTDPGLQRDG